MEIAQSFLTEQFGLNGQVAVVIGGTGTLGGALCEGFAAAGAHVVVAGRSESRGQERVAAITELGGSASFLPVSATERESIAALRDTIVAERDRVDVLVNCAGVNDSTPYEDIGDDDWNRVIEGNLFATHLGCQIFGAQMSKQENGGTILNIGSVTAHLPLSRVFAYSASKAAVVNLTKNLAREYASQGVRVNAICPGFFPAEQNRKILDQPRIDSIMSQTPMGRFGDPKELVGAALLFASRTAGSFITGAALYVDGGFTAMRF